ncbi:hypothetical protein B0H14DRAFT_2610439 [Mycena olivaceomarginata]|nr:hypothetical protein B0H14DRAFT_2610439 [Mycena olivaceomarginata]
MEIFFRQDILAEATPLDQERDQHFAATLAQRRIFSRMVVEGQIFDIFTPQGGVRRPDTPDRAEREVHGSRDVAVVASILNTHTEGDIAGGPPTDMPYVTEDVITDEVPTLLEVGAVQNQSFIPESADFDTLVPNSQLYAESIYRLQLRVELPAQTATDSPSIERPTADLMAEAAPDMPSITEGVITDDAPTRFEVDTAENQSFVLGSADLDTLVPTLQLYLESIYLLQLHAQATDSPSIERPTADSTAETAPDMPLYNRRCCH